MDFYEVVREAVKLLQAQGRLTYRTLRRQFQLDDEALQDLKDELLFSHPVIDHDGRGLVWTGETEPQPEPTSTTPVTRQDPFTRVEPPASHPPTPDAERRQLTVMFCDLANSTRLSGQLDPEDLRDVIRAYQSTSAEVIERYDGYIAQHLGDGLMVYFGWPQAHEDDAQRAVHAGLGILDAMRGLNTRLEQEKGIRLAVRIGIHTGLVVVGEIGKGASQEHLALGEAPNVASRIEGLAAPNTIAISAVTSQLVQGYFICEDLGQHVLKGVDDCQQVYRVVRERDAQNHFDVTTTRKLTPLVGRESETTLIFERWQQVKEGHGQVVLLNGEAGIGKTRLLRVLRDHVADEPHTRLECRSSPYYQNTALYSIGGMLQRMLRWQQDDTPEIRLDKLERALYQYRIELGETVPLLANLLSLSIPEDRYPPLNLSPQRQRQKTLETILALLLQPSEHQPVLFILEDLHWTDPSTLELLDLLIDQTPTATICVLLTCRPAFQAPWNSRSYLTQITLNHLSGSQIERMTEQVAGGKRLPVEVLQQIIDKTDGVPLFVEEMTKAVLESGTLKDVNGQYELVGSLSALAIPATLQDSLMARLDRLVTAKAVAQYAAVIGRQFSYDMLRAVSQLNERTLQDELHRLVEAELLYQRGLPPQATYTFKHALVQDAAYQSLLKSTRLQYHQRIAVVWEEQFTDAIENRPELIAHHYTEAGLTEEAIHYWHKAGQRAAQRSAHVETIEHLTKGLELLTTLPQTSTHFQQELDLQVALGAALLAIKGNAAPEVEQVYNRAQELCLQVEDGPQLFPVLFNLWGFYNARAEYQMARKLAEQILSLDHLRHHAARLQGHRALGWTLLLLGEPVAALVHLEQGIALYNSQQRDLALFYGEDPGMGCRVFAARALWLLGYPDQALKRCQEALALTQELCHPYSLAYALFHSAECHERRREWQMVQERLEELMALASKQGFIQRMSQGTFLQGKVLDEQGRSEAGLTQMYHSLGALRKVGHLQSWPMYLASLAKVLGRLNRVEQGLKLLTEAISIGDKTGERWYEAELHRLRGQLLLQLPSDNQTETEACFYQSLNVARRQQARSWELRTATSLARLWQSQGKCQEAQDLLAPVYGWFTEGFETADLQEAKGLLEELT